MHIADPVVKICPKCASEKTTVRPRSRLEAVFALGTKMQKYVCLECGKAFEAADRRRFKRSAAAR